MSLPNISLIKAYPSLAFATEIITLIFIGLILAFFTQAGINTVAAKGKDAILSPTIIADKAMIRSLIEVKEFNPTNSATAIPIKSNISLTFNQSVDKQSAQNHFVISPNVSGTFSWDQNTLTFTPTLPFAYLSTYTVTLTKGVEDRTAITSVNDFSTTFTTAEFYETIRLNVPTYSQKYNLSCEFADMSMLLAYRGIKKTEDELIAQTPFDKTPHVGDIWGDPDTGFLGDVNGIWFGTGYGAYHPVISAVLNKYRPTETHVGWDIKSLATELKAGNPAFIWGCSTCNKPTSWVTNEGKKIYAYEHYHSFVVTGFSGNVNNPLSFIVKDSRPGKGEVTLSKNEFLKKWSAFNNTAVVVK